MNPRAKGARGERELAAYLRAFGFEARRGQQFSGGDESPDVVTSIPGVHVECKRVNRVAMLEWCRQSERDAGPAQVPLVIWRPDREIWRVTLPLDPYLALLPGFNPGVQPVN